MQTVQLSTDQSSVSRAVTRKFVIFGTIILVFLVVVVFAVLSFWVPTSSNSSVVPSSLVMDWPADHKQVKVRLPTIFTAAIENYKFIVAVSVVALVFITVISVVLYLSSNVQVVDTDDYEAGKAQEPVAQDENESTSIVVGVVFIAVFALLISIGLILWKVFISVKPVHSADPTITRIPEIPGDDTMGVHFDTEDVSVSPMQADQKHLETGKAFLEQFHKNAPPMTVKLKIIRYKLVLAVIAREINAKMIDGNVVNVQDSAVMRFLTDKNGPRFWYCDKIITFMDDFGLSKAKVLRHLYSVAGMLVNILNRYPSTQISESVIEQCKTKIMTCTITDPEAALHYFKTGVEKAEPKRKFD